LQDESAKSGSLFALSSEAKSSFLSALVRYGVRVGFLLDHDDVWGLERVSLTLFLERERRELAGGHSWSGVDEDGAVIVGGGCKDTLGLRPPRGDGTLRLGGFAEDETQEHIQTTESEEEKCSNKSEIVDVMREDLSRDALDNVSLKNRFAWKKGYLQALEDTKRTEAEFRTKNREVAVEELHWP